VLFKLRKPEPEPEEAAEKTESSEAAEPVTDSGKVET
jgi:hypothetical protein